MTRDAGSKTYRLFYGDIELGEVTDEYFDFPRMSGNFRRNEAAFAGSPLRDKLQRYFEHSLAAERLLTEGKEDSPEWAESAAYEKERFVDFIESSDWHLLAGGTKEPILIPIFGEDDSIVWRWNF